MKVGNLIKKLQRYPIDLEVVIDDDSDFKVVDKIGEDKRFISLVPITTLNKFRLSEQEKSTALNAVEVLRKICSETRYCSDCIFASNDLDSTCRLLLHPPRDWGTILERMYKEV